MSWYEKKYNYLRKHQTLSNSILFVSTWLTRLVYVSYGLLVIYACIHQRWTCIWVPAIGFGLETWIRATLNQPRPYEVLDFPALKPKATKGKSFPSRHCFSVAIISMAMAYVNLWLGVLFILFTLVLMICRVCIGVHWIKDVVVGALLGWLLGWIGFFIL